MLTLPMPRDMAGGRDHFSPAVLLGLDTGSDPRSGTERFFFAPPLVAHKLKTLKNMLDSSLFVVVIGERGNGKTTLLRRLIASGKPNWRLGRVHLKRVAGGQLSRRLQGISHGMVLLEKAGQRPTLIIDNAHKLTPSELKAIIRKGLIDGGGKLKNLVLFAEPAIRGILGRIAGWLPANAVLDKMDLIPFTEKQTSEYLEFRIARAGILPLSPFSPLQLRTIHEKSGGLPGWINLEAIRMLKSMAPGKGRAGTQRSLSGALSTLWRRRPGQRRPLFAGP